MDNSERGHRPDGKFLSNHEMEMIAAHQGQIEEGLGGYDTVKEMHEATVNKEVVNKDVKGRAHRPDGKFMSNYQREQVEAHMDEIVTGLKEYNRPAKTATTLTSKVAAADQKSDDFTVEDQGLLQETLAIEQALRELGVEVPDVVEDEEESEVSVFDTPKEQGDTQILPTVAAEDAPESEQAPVKGRLRVGLKKVSARITTAMQKAYTWGNIQAAEAAKKVSNYINDIEGDGARKERRQKFAIAGVILGASAIALSMKYGLDLDTGKGSGTHNSLTPGGPKSGILNAQLDLPTPGNVRHLSAGENPWSQSIDYANSLGYNVSNTNPSDVTVIDAIKDEVLRINNFSDPTQLPVGTEIHMPSPEQMEEIFKKYKS